MVQNCISRAHAYFRVHGDLTSTCAQACTTDGKQPKKAPKNPLDKKCKGEKRMFQWNNSYFQDVTSGKCEPRKVSPEDAEWFPTSDVNAKGRAPNAKEEEVCTHQRHGGLRALNIPS